MHISILMHSSAHHPLAAFSLRIYYKAVIYGHAHCHSIECDCLQNCSSYSCRTSSALITAPVTWWTLPVNEIIFIHPCPQHQPTLRSSGTLNIWIKKILPYCPSNHQHIKCQYQINNNHWAILCTLLSLWINHLSPNNLIALIY